MENSIFSDEYSGDSEQFLSSLNMAGPYEAATALRDSLADDLVQWQLLETRLRRASREIPIYCRSVFTKCDALVTRFDNLSAHEVGQTTELQHFSAKFPSLTRDLARVLQMMTEQCDIAPSAAQQALIASAHISTDPPMPPLPPQAPPPTHCAVLSHTVNADVTARDLHNVGTVVTPPNQAPKKHGSDDGAASHITTVIRELTPISSVDSVPLIQIAMEELEQF
jgi:hypothetical protein